LAYLRKRGKKWYYTVIDASGRKREYPGVTDKRETERLAAAAESGVARERAGLTDPKAEKYAAEGRKPLSAHLDDYHSHLAAKGNTAHHAHVTRTHSRTLLDLASVTRISDLSPSRIQGALAKLRAKRLGLETLNHYVQAIKGFSRWLWIDGRSPDHSLVSLKKFNAATDRRRIRRALSEEEARRLVKAVLLGPIVKGMSGPDRTVLYSLALATGLRANELRTLTPERFHLDDELPCVKVLARLGKNRKEVDQPIPPALVPILREWLKDRPTDAPIFGACTDRTAELLRIDLASAEIPYETPEGVVDFHALRGSFITALVESGATVKEAQELARHSTPVLTIGLYAKADRRKVAAAVAKLPDLAPHDIPWRIVAPGEQIKNGFADYLPNDPDGMGRMVALPGGVAGFALTGPGEALDPLFPGDFGVEDLEIVSTGARGRTGTGVPPRRILSHLDERPNAVPSNELGDHPPESADHLPNDTCATLEDPRLATIVSTWSDLPEALKVEIVRLVNSAKS